MATWLLPASTAAIAAVFATTVFLRWRRAPKRHLLLWTLGLYGLAAAAAAQAIAEATGSWSELLYRTYYFLVGALVATLGAGTVYLLRQRKPADLFLYAVLGLLALYAVACVATPLADSDLSAAHVESGAKVASIPMRILVVVLNITGAAALIAGACVSYLNTKRPHNLLILAGALVFSAAGGIAGLFPSGETSTYALYVGNLVGVTLLFLGFLTGRPAHSAVAAGAAAAAAASPPS